MKKYFLPIILVAIAGGMYVYQVLVPNQSALSETPIVEDLTEESPDNARTSTASTAVLTDVSGGNATGIAISDFSLGTYTMTAEFENLPDLEEGFFYEGWVVRQGNDMSVVSSGATQVQDDGTHLNIFESSKDLSDHTFYVLTLEPDDGDPAPAEHILEGYFE